MLTKHHSSRCSSSDCGMLLDPRLSRLECTQCAYRKLGFGRKKQEGQRVIKTPVKVKHFFQSSRHLLISQYQPTPSPYPRYQCLSALLSELKSRFISFLDAHSFYHLSKLAHGAGQPDNPTVFQFDGEFSVVALDFDILGRQEEIAKNALKLKEEIEDLCGFKFGLVSLRFMCRFPYLRSACPVRIGSLHMKEGLSDDSPAFMTYLHLPQLLSVPRLISRRVQKQCRGNWRLLCLQIVRTDCLLGEETLCGSV
jgi:hypothetical protein